jgi:hypothetical protein
LHAAIAGPSSDTQFEETAFDKRFKELGVVLAGKTIGEMQRSASQATELAVVEGAAFGLERLVLANPRNKREVNIFQKRLEAVRKEASAIPMEQRATFLKEALFWGQNNPNRDSDYSDTYRNLAFGVVGSLVALTNPVTAILLPLAVKGGIEGGPFLQAYLHVHADEVPDATVVASTLPGETMTAFPTAEAGRTWYENYVQGVVDKRPDLGRGLERYAPHGPPHHTWGNQLQGNLETNDPLFTNPGLEPAFMGTVTKPLKFAAALGLLGPVGGLLSGLATGAAFGLAAGSTTHKWAHEPDANKSLLTLALQATGAVETKAEHDLHHKEGGDPSHVRNFSGTFAHTDDLLTQTHALEIFDLLVASTTQDRDPDIDGKRPARPQSWARNPLERLRVVGASTEQVATATAALKIDETKLRNAAQILGVRPELLAGGAALGRLSTSDVESALRELGLNPSQTQDAVARLRSTGNSHPDSLELSAPVVERLFEELGVSKANLAEARQALGVSPEAMSIRATHQLLVAAHGELVKLQRRSDQALKGALADGKDLALAKEHFVECPFLDQPVHNHPDLLSIAQDFVELIQTTNRFVAPPIPSLDVSTATVAQLYGAMRCHVDGVILEKADIASSLFGGSAALKNAKDAVASSAFKVEDLDALLLNSGRAVEAKFVRDLYLRTPERAWPKLSDVDVQRGFRLIDEMNGWPEGTSGLFRSAVLKLKKATELFR